MRILMISAVLTLGAALAGCDDGCGERTRLPDSRAVLLHPDSSAFSAVAPDTFYVKMETSKGDIVIQVVKEWAPNGATRFYNLVRNGYYDGDKFFRVVEGFAAQFGVTGYPKVDEAWGKREIPADPVAVKNTRGML